MSPSFYHHLHPPIIPAPRAHWRYIQGSIVLVLLSLVKPAPIGSPINEGAILAPVGSAIWFFLWAQHRMLQGDPLLWGVLVPLGVLIWLVVSHYLLPHAWPSELGRWFPAGNRLAQVSVFFLVRPSLVSTFLGQ